MLRIHRKLQLKLPQAPISLARMQFSPVVVDNDELSQAISDEQQHHEHWDLTDGIDAQKLDDFWTEVQQDVEKDPKWFNFAS